MTGRIVGGYESDDGDVFIPVAAWPDESEAGQGYANQTGLLVVSEGRRTIRTQDCECLPASDSCADADGQPCVVNEANECWWFTTFENTDAGRRDLAHDIGDEKHQVWEPAPRDPRIVREGEPGFEKAWPVAPSNVGGGGT